MTGKTRAEFEAACALLPEGVAWGALLTPEIARGIAEASLATKAAPEPTPPQAPLRRGSTGVCSRSTCLCEQEQLGDQCIWLRPTDAALEAATGEPHIDGWPLYSGLPPTQAPEEMVQPSTALQRYHMLHIDGESSEALERLRAFCGLAMNSQDWIDVEPFFTALTAQAAEVARLRDALLHCARLAEALRLPCGEDPESAQAIRNGQYQGISLTAHIALGTIRGPAAPSEADEIARLTAEVEGLRKDAARYHWLRSRVPGGTYRIMGVIYSEGGKGVDEAIDAAIGEKTNG